MYETLFYYDLLTGKMVPLLAESPRENPDSFEVVLHEKARWSDGKPVTGEDIKFTFDLGKKHKDIPIAPIWTYLSAVRLPEVEAGTVPAGGHSRRILFEFSRQEEPARSSRRLRRVPNAPQHVIEPLLAGERGHERVPGDQVPGSEAGGRLGAVPHPLGREREDRARP